MSSWIRSTSLAKIDMLRLKAYIVVVRSFPSMFKQVSHSAMIDLFYIPATRFLQTFEQLMVIFWFEEILDPAQDTWKASRVHSSARCFYWNCHQRVRVDLRRLKSTRRGARHMAWLDAYGSAKKALSIFSD